MKFIQANRDGTYVLRTDGYNLKNDLVASKNEYKHWNITDVNTGMYVAANIKTYAKCKEFVEGTTEESKKLMEKLLDIRKNSEHYKELCATIMAKAKELM